MRPRTLIAVGTGLVILIGLFLIVAPDRPGHDGVRGAHLARAAALPEPRVFDRRQSAALIIGIRKFTRDKSTVEVKLAADDAVDLAYVFALDRRVALVSPSRVVIALSGRPQKEESKRRLEELQQAGARIEKAETSDILMLLQRQAALAGKDGMLIVSIATHGFVRDGVSYILGSASVYHFAETAVPLLKLLDIAGMSEAPRSLFFVDACRERITGDARAGALPDTAAPLISRIKRARGQVVLYAAAAGGYAYDGDGNGVFTAAVLEGLKCKAALVRGAVTVETLHTFVERTVRRWIRQNRDATVGAATQVSMEGDSKNMPLAMCVGTPPPPPPRDVGRAAGEGSKVTAFASDGMLLWFHVMRSGISRLEVADLDDDGSHEVVVGAGSSLRVFDRTGASVWSTDETMTLHTFVIDHLLRRDPTLQITTIWNKDDQSVVAAYSANGQRRFRYVHHGRLQYLTIDRPTPHHNRRILAAGTDSEAGTAFGVHKPVAALVMLDGNGELIWKGIVMPATERLMRVTVANRDKYSREITLATASGEKIQLDFDGKVLARSSQQIRFKVLPHNAGRPES